MRFLFRPILSKARRRKERKEYACGAFSRCLIETWKRGALAFCLMLFLTHVGCAPSKSKSTDELRSDLLYSLSLTGEAELLIRQIETGAVPRHFRSSQAQYLRDEALRKSKQLRESQVDPEKMKIVNVCVNNLERLAVELSQIGVRSDSEQISDSRQRLEKIEKDFADAHASL